jgi:hypothetical protein
VAALDKEVSISKQMLAIAKADAQKRLEQLEAKLSEAERAKMEELAEREAEALRKLDEEVRHRAVTLENAEAAQREAERSKQEAMASVKCLEKAQLQLQTELEVERQECAKLREEVAALQKQNAIAAETVQGELCSLLRELEMLRLHRSALEAELADAERAKKVLAEREAEALRKLDEGARHSTVMLEKATTALRVTERSKDEALIAAKGLEKAQQKLQVELGIERQQCAQLREDVVALQKQNASGRRAGQSEPAGANSNATLRLLSRIREPSG